MDLETRVAYFASWVGCALVPNLFTGRYPFICPIITVQFGGLQRKFWTAAIIPSLGHLHDS